MPDQKQDFRKSAPVKKPKFMLMLLIIVAGIVVLYAYNTLIKKPKPPGMDEAKLKEEMTKEEQQAIPVRVFKAARQDFTDYFPSMGTVKGVAEVNLKFETTGIVEAINFEEGDVIKKGDVIASLNQRDAQLNIEYNKSKLKTAQAEMQAAKKKQEVYQKLYEAGSIIKAKLDEVNQEYEIAKSKIETAKLEVEHSENELEKTSLFAPIDGVLTSKEVEVGELANPNTKIGSLVDISSVYVEIGITEKDIERIRMGQNVKVNVDTYPGRDFYGSVDKIFPQIEGRSRTLTVKIKLDNKDMLIKPGMFARALINIYEKKGAILIPIGAIRQKEDNYFVFVVEKNQQEKDEAKLRTIKIAYRTIENAIIEEGVSEGELVVFEQQGELKDKSPCEVLEVQESETKEEKPEGEEIKQPKVEGEET